MTARMLALVSDCYGMGGGIARYNQDLFEGLAEGGADIVVLPRHGDAAGIALPKGIRQEPAIFSRLRYPLSALLLAWRKGPFDVVFCGHAYMAPIAWAVARLSGARYWLQTHGAEIWKIRPDLLRRAIESADLVTTVSRGTRHSLLGWVELPPDRVRVLPDTVQDKFVPGVVPAGFRERMALGPGPVLLTVGFLVVDEVAPTGTAAEAFAWVGTAFAVGSASGAALTGLLLDAAGNVRIGFLVAPVTIALAAAVFALLPRDPPSTTARPTP